MLYVNNKSLPPETKIRYNVTLYCANSNWFIKFYKFCFSSDPRLDVAYRIFNYTHTTMTKIKHICNLKLIDCEEISFHTNILEHDLNLLFSYKIQIQSFLTALHIWNIVLILFHLTICFLYHLFNYMLQINSENKSSTLNYVDFQYFDIFMIACLFLKIYGTNDYLI